MPEEEVIVTTDELVEEAPLAEALESDVAEMEAPESMEEVTEDTGEEIA